MNSRFDSILDKAADRFAESHGQDRERSRRIYRRMGEVDWHGLLGRVFPRHTMFEDAVNLAGVEAAMQCFETEDLAQLDLRVALVEYLGWYDTPLYDVRELGDLTDGFASHLEDNREALLKTGRPGSYFAKCHWLDSRLSNLWYTKLPIKIRLDTGRFTHDESKCREHAYGAVPYDSNGNTILPHSEEGNLVLDFKWGRVEHVDAIGRRGRVVKIAEYHETNYEDAPLIQGLSEDDAEKLEQGRRKFLDLKLKILAILSRVGRPPPPEGIWEICVPILVEALTWEEIEFYLRMDRFFIGCDIHTGKVLDPNRRYMPGSITDLLEVIGHYEKELKTGVFARTRAALGNFVHSGEPGERRLPADLYLKLLGKPERKELDSTLDRFLELEDEESAYWVDYVARVNRALNEEFYEEGPRVRRKRKHALKFDPFVEGFAHFARSHLETTGSLPLMSTAYGSAVGESDFKKAGESEFLPGLLWAPDFSVVVRGDTPYCFKGNQALGIEFMIGRSIQLKGPIDIPKDAILVEIGEKNAEQGKGEDSSRFRDVFKSSGAVGKDRLIVDGSRSGFVRLSVCSTM